MSQPIQITRNGSILTLKNIVNKVKVFVVKCNDFGMCYRYQESTDGVHNYNDNFFLGIDLCIFLRNSLQQHVPIGSIVKTLEQQLHTKLKAQTIINACLHFEALSDHLYNFNCCVCGYHPKIVIINLNKKINFRCSMSDVQLPEEFDENDADLVDSETFWSNVESSIIIRGFPGRTVYDFEAEPYLLAWSPSLVKALELVPYL